MTDAYTQSDDERERDRQTVQRLDAHNAIQDDALAYQHASHGCPNGYPDAPCPICDRMDEPSVLFI